MNMKLPNAPKKLELAKLLRLHGRADDLNALVEDRKRLRPSEREAIEGIQEACLRAATEIEQFKELKDSIYLERNRCVALIARMAVEMGLRVTVQKTAIEGWSEDWHGVIYIQLPAGQVSWHFHDSQAHLFDGLPRLDPQWWDGHDTPEKYRRVDASFKVGDQAE